MDMDIKGPNLILYGYLTRVPAPDTAAGTLPCKPLPVTRSPAFSSTVPTQRKSQEKGGNARTAKPCLVGPPNTDSM